MLERIFTNLKNKCLLVRDQPILVGVSGGPDSLCLLDTLHRLDYPLIVAHFDHILRQESIFEAEAVRKTSEEMGLPFVLGREDVAAFAVKDNLSLEEAARSLRYNFLFQQAELHQAQAVAVGHTADDQVETVFMHLLRGAGLSGLRGMTYCSLPNSWSQTIPLVRPLLNVWREEILAYLAERGRQYSLDASNLDTRFYRNRLRNELIPYLESIHPRLRENLWRTAEILGQDYAVLESLTEAAWERCILEEGLNYLAFAPAPLRQQPLGLQRHLIRKGINRLRPGLRDVDFEAVERAVQFLNEPSRSGRADLVAGLYLLYEKTGDFAKAHKELDHRDTESTEKNYISDNERLWLAAWEADLPNTEWPQVEPNAEIKLNVPGEALMGGGWRMVAELVGNVEKGHAQALANEDPFQAWLDLDNLQLPLIVRSRRSGDRFRPLGMGGSSVKVPDLMINLKLPRRARDGWPLLLSGREIAWIPGLRIGQSYRVKDNTVRILGIRLYCTL